jgi:hypothetical protein
MQPIDWFRFIASGEPQHVSITRIDRELCLAINCSSNLVKIDHRYALKSIHKHHFQPEHFQILPAAIQHGRVVADRSKHLTFFYLDAVFGHWFQASIKRDESASELWVTTFHQASSKEVGRMTRKHGILRHES